MNIDWSRLKKYSEIEEGGNIHLVIDENLWCANEGAFIAEQLLALEDDDPTALPGTEREWRDYRIQVRAWKEGNTSFPDKDKRPSRPAGD